MTNSPMFTQRERQVLEGMAEGKSNSAIGRGLHISEDTVKTHARRLYRKLGVDDRTGAVVRALRAGLLVLDGITIGPAGSAPPRASQSVPCHPYRDTSQSVRLVADDHDAALLSSAMFGPRPNDPGIALRRSRAAIERLVGAR